MFYGCRSARPRAGMTESEKPSGSLQISTGFAARAAPNLSATFYAVYDGTDFAATERGQAAIIAQAHEDAGLSSTALRDAAQLAVHSFAEGYFGAQRTLSPRRAAQTALIALNRWLSQQMHGERRSHPAQVSLSALLLQQRHIGIVQIGICQLYRLRGGTLTPLIRPHFTLGPDAHPARALGLEDDVAIGFSEVDAMPDDMLLLLAGASTPEQVYNALSPLGTQDFTSASSLAAQCLALLPGPDVAVIVLHIQSLPLDEYGAANALAALPIRPPPKPGEVWDDFIIGNTLFRGRYTVLMAAHDRLSGQEVALKIPLKSMLTDEIFTAGFMREAWIGSTVRGANLVHYIDVPAPRRTALYLVMPLYIGETLEARLHRPPKMNLPEGLGIALKLCEAVQDLAAIQIIHRDIKPDNVMLLDAGGGVKLLDLGLAYLPGIDATTALKPGGTIRYMAPELLNGQPASAPSEVYALAVTIYRMFAGGLYPFGQNESVPLARLRPDLPRWLGESLARALSPAPQDRYPDAAAFAAALQIGLVEGQETGSPRFRLPLSTLQRWQAATIIFAIATAILALRALS